MSDKGATAKDLVQLIKAYHADGDDELVALYSHKLLELRDRLEKSVRDRGEIPTENWNKAYRIINNELGLDDTMFRILVTESAQKYVHPTAEEIAEKPSMNENIDDFITLINYFGHDAKMSDAGRILIPQDLRQAVGIEREIILLGKTNHFEIWDAQSLRERIQSILADKDLKSRLKAEGI